MKLTKAQTNALQTIADNPGQVIAWVRGNRNYLTINGNTEHKLLQMKLIEVREGGKAVTNGREHTLKLWALTDAGKAALGLTTKTHATARAEGRKMGLTDAQIERFISLMDK